MIHLVQMHRGILRPVCGAFPGEGSRAAQDDVVSCALCRRLVYETLREGAPLVTVSRSDLGEPTTTTTWTPRVARC